MTLEEHKASPNQIRFFERLFEIKRRLNELVMFMEERKRKEIEAELTSISEEFDAILKEKE